MKPFNLDLSKFKKVSSDDSSTTMKHSDGHSLTLHHAAIDPKQLQALSKLPLLSQENKLPEKPMAEAGTVEPNPEPNETDAPAVPVPAEYVPGVSNPGPAATTGDNPSADASGGADSSEEDAEDATPADVTSAPSAPTSEPSPAAPPDPAQPTTSAQSAPADLAHMFSADKGQNLGLIAQEDAAMANDLAQGHIKPETYSDLFAKKDTLGKIGTIFGLLLGGAGAGLTHQENPVTAMWKQQINNDLEAQKANVSNKQTLLGINRKRFGDAITAQNFTIMQQNRAALHDLTTKVNTLPVGSKPWQDAQNQLALVGQFVNTENYKLGDQIASRQAFMKSFQNQPGGDEAMFQAQQNMLRRGNSDQQKLAEQNELHHVPGFQGQTSIPVSADNRDRLMALKQYDQKAQEYVDFAKQHAMNWANLNPVDRAAIANQGAAMGANLQSLYRNKIRGGVYKKGEQEFIEQIIPDQPAKWSSSFSAIPRVAQTIQDNRSDMQNTAGSLGLSVPQGQSQPITQITGGIQYVKVPGGWKRAQ